MSGLAPLETLYEVDRGGELPLPAELRSIYGRLGFPPGNGRPYVIGNFVTTLDGVVSLQAPGESGGGPISGFNAHDRFVMGLLRAAADAVVVGAGTLRALPQELWTPGYVCPAFAGAYQQLRTALGKPDPLLTVVVTARGDVDPSVRVFQSGAAPVLIATTPPGARHLRELGLPASVQILEGGAGGELSARSILELVARVRPSERVLVEGGPHLLGDFFRDQCLDEQFLTLSPQVAGRDGSPPRPGLVAGELFAPEHPLWGTLIAVARAGSHLFLRYAFPFAA